MGARICVVLPALNEAQALPAALYGAPSGPGAAHSTSGDVRTIVVDNGSTDDTASVARNLGVEVITETHRGFGAACKAGLDAAGDAEVIVYMDADGTCDWGDLDALTAPILNGHADMALGWRKPSLRDTGSMPAHVAFANAFLAKMCGRLCGAAIHDVPPYRAIRRTSLVALDLQDRTYGWPLEMVLQAGRGGLRIAEVPVHYRCRTGKSKVTGTLRGTAKATARMAGVLWQHRR